MKTPQYRWVCQKCDAANEPSADRCTSCGSSPFLAGRDIEVAMTEEQLAAKAKKREYVALFFPEIIPAAVVVVIAPIWAMSLLLKGKALLAFILAAGAGAGTYGFYWFLKRGNAWVAHFAMVVVLCIALWVQSVSH